MNRTIHATLVVACIASGLGCAEGKQESTVYAENSMQTVCFGEHQMNLPYSFGFRVPGSSVTLYFGRDADFKTVEFQVVQEKVDPEQFLDTVEHRAAQIASKMNARTDGPMLVGHETLGDGAVLLRYFKRRLSTEAHVHELHRLVGGAHVLLQASSYEGKVEPVEARLKHLSANVSPVSGMHDAPGFCLGSVAINSESDYQMATIHYRDENAGHQDISVEIEVSTLPKSGDEPRLINRIGGNFLGLGFSPRVLKKGEARLADMAAEQWMGRDNSEKRVEHLFVIDTYPEIPAPQTPGLQITLETGGVPRAPAAIGLRPYIDTTIHAGGQEEPVTSSLNDHEAIALWESIIASLRRR